MSKRGENIYKRKDGRWEGRILTELGKYQYFYDRSYSGVKLKMKDWLKANAMPKTYIKKDTRTVSEALDWWLKYCYGSVKDSTYENYYYCTNKYIIPFFNKCKVEMIDKTHINGFVKYICADSSLSKAYQRKILQIFKTALKKILDQDLRLSMLLEALDMPKKASAEKSIDVFSMFEQSQIEQKLDLTSTKDIGLLLCFYTGIRLGEVCALRWCDIDIYSKTINIQNTLIRTKNFEEGGSKTKLALGHPKSRSSIRKIPIPDFLCDLLCSITPNNNDPNCFLLSGAISPLDPRSFQRHFKNILTNARVIPRKFHAIRHTFVTRALEAGIDIKTISEILGHSAVTSTINTYSHSLMEQKRLAISKLNNLHTSKLLKIKALQLPNRYTPSKKPSTNERIRLKSGT